MSDIVINNTSSTSEYAISINQLETNLFEINVDTSVNKYDISINDQSSNFNTTIESDNSQYSIELIPKLDICELIVYKDATIPLDFDPSSNQNITGNWTFNPTTYFNNGIGVVGTVSTNLHGDSEDWYTAYLHSQMTSGNPHNITLADIDINFAEINYWTKINDKLSYIGDVSIDMNRGGSNTLNSNGINLGNITGNRQISNYTLLNNVGTDINIYDDLSPKYYNNGVANIQKLGVIRFAYDMQDGDFDVSSGSSKLQIFLRNGSALVTDNSTLIKKIEIDKKGNTSITGGLFFKDYSWANQGSIVSTAMLLTYSSLASHIFQASNAGSPTLLLDRLASVASIKALGTNANNRNLFLDSSGSTGYVSLNHYISDNVILAAGGGKIGINNTNPLYSFHQKTDKTEYASMVVEGANSNYGARVCVGNDLGAIGGYLILYGSTHATTPNQLALENLRGNLSFTTGTGGIGTEKMSILSNGDIGINTTNIPAWNNLYNAIEFPLSSIAYRKSFNIMLFNSNAYYDDVWRYKSTGKAAYYYLGDGIHRFNVAASGAANSAITWASMLHISLNGVGIGVVPTTYKLDVYSTDTDLVNFLSSNGGNFSVDKFGNTRIKNQNKQSHYLGADGTNQAGIHYIYDSNTVRKISLAALGNSYFNGGYVGFGTDTPLYQVHVKNTEASFGNVVNESTNSSYGAAYYLGNDKLSTAAYLILYGSTHSSLPSQLALKNNYGEIAFFTGTNNAGTEKMRILSNGYVGINTTEPLYMLDINESRASYFTTRIKNTSSTGYGVHIQAGGTTQDILRLSNYSGTERFAFYGDGKIKLAGKTYSFPSNTEVNDYVLTTNGSGGLSWSSKTGGGVLTGVASINGDSSTAQSILAGTGISITNSGASHTISASFEETDDLNDVVSRGSTTTKSITALKFIKSGGTSAQFLKANGDSDSNTYLTTITKALVESVLTDNIISHTHNYTNYAEPGIFSGGGSPSLATGVTGAEIRTLIGAGTSSTIGTVTSVIAGTAITITGTSTVSPVINVSLGTGYEQSARGNHNHDSTYQAIGVYLSSLIATKDIPTDGLLRKTGSTTVSLDTRNYLTSVTQIQVIPDGYAYITTSWNLSINENVYTSKSNTTALTTTLSNVVDGSSGIYIIDTTAAFILTLAHTGYAWYADENAPTTSTAKQLQLAVGRHIITFTAKGASNVPNSAIYINVASYKSF